eukprot:gene15221-23243_t
MSGRELSGSRLPPILTGARHIDNLFGTSHPAALETTGCNAVTNQPAALLKTSGWFPCSSDAAMRNNLKRVAGPVPPVEPPGGSTGSGAALKKAYVDWMDKEARNWYAANGTQVFARDTPMCLMEWEMQPEKAPPAVHLQYNHLNHDPAIETNVSKHSRNAFFCPKPLRPKPSSCVSDMDALIGCVAGNTKKTGVVNQTLYFVGDSTMTLPYLRLASEAYGKGYVKQPEVIVKGAKGLACNHFDLPNGPTFNLCLAPAAARLGPEVAKDLVKRVRKHDVLLLMLGTHYNVWTISPRAGNKDEALEPRSRSRFPEFFPSEYIDLWTALYSDVQAVLQSLRELKTMEPTVRVAWSSTLPQFFSTPDRLPPQDAKARGRCLNTSGSIPPVREFIVSSALHEYLDVIDVLVDASSAARNAPSAMGSITSVGWDCTHLCADANMGIGQLFSKAICD